jgi:serine/threonine protein kinase
MVAAVLPEKTPYTTTPDTRPDERSLSKTWLEITTGVSRGRFPFVGCKDGDLRENLTLEFIEKLGSGTYAEIWRVDAYNADKSLFWGTKAIKVHCFKADSEAYYKTAHSEYEAMKKVAGLEGVLSLVGKCEFTLPSEEKCLWILSEFIDGQNLHEWTADKDLKTGCVKDFATQLLHVLSGLSEKGICHADLKPENIMRKKNGVLKLLDFGLAHLENVGTHNTYSLFYRPPERIMEIADMFTSSGDVWALGCILYELYCGYPLFGIIGCNDFETESLRGALNLMEKKLGTKIPAEWIEQMPDSFKREYFEEEDFSFGEINPYSIKEPYLEDEIHALTSMEEDIMDAAVENGDDPDRARLLADLIKEMLKFDGRSSARELLTHPFFTREGA